MRLSLESAEAFGSETGLLPSAWGSGKGRDGKDNQKVALVLTYLLSGPCYLGLIGTIIIPLLL